MIFKNRVSGNRSPDETRLALAKGAIKRKSLMGKFLARSGTVARLEEKIRKKTAQPEPSERETPEEIETPVDLFNVSSPQNPFQIQDTQQAVQQYTKNNTQFSDTMGQLLSMRANEALKINQANTWFRENYTTNERVKARGKLFDWQV